MSIRPPTGQQIAQLKAALLDAFTLDELGRMLRTHFDANLEQIVPTRGQSGAQIADHVVRAYAAQPDGFVALAQATRTENPGNPALKTFAAGIDGQKFGVLPLPDELTPYRDQISAQIGDNVRNVAVGKNINQTLETDDMFES